MGRQGGIGTFLGSDRRITGFADDGKPVWRKKSSLNRKKWLKHPHMEGQRIAARYFRAASVVAGNLWSALPFEMRRLADGGGFNRLVGHCVTACGEDAFEAEERAGRAVSCAEDWIALHGKQRSNTQVLFAEDWLAGRGQEEVGAGVRVSSTDGQLVDVEDLRSLDLSIDSSGPHRVDSRPFTVDSLGFEGDLGHVLTCSYRLVGMDALCDELDAARGCEVGKRSGNYLMAHRFIDDSIVRMPDFATMGSCEGWGKAWKERSMYGGKRPVRRVRVWVHAVEVVRTEWNAIDKQFELAEHCSHNTEGFVTDWLHLQGHAIASAYAIEGGRIVLPPLAANGTGCYVVFTTIEIAEKRGRHWVRLPFCCRMRVSDVVFVEQVVEGAVSEVAGSSEQVAVGRAVLVALPGRILEGSGMRVWDFEEWERHFGDLQGWHDLLVDGVLECCLVEFKVSLGDNGQRVRCLYEVAGGLVRAGP